MKREELIALRQRKKRRKRLLIAGIAAAAVAVAALAVFAAPRLKNRKTEETVVETSVNTAELSEMTDTTQGETGWNLDDDGWWYKTEDSKIYTSGWMTIDGNRYYFLENGYLATGWTRTSDGTDCYFDASGRYLPDAEPMLVALTYDGGPSQNTEAVLDVLEEYHARATFMVTGTQAERYPEVLERADELGMEIGNRTYDNVVLEGLDADEIRETLEKNDKLIASITGETPSLVRPPGGAVNDTVRESVDRPLILWDVDAGDAENQAAEDTAEAVIAEVQEGSIILMHDLYESSAEATEQIVSRLQQMGYRFVTVSELAGDGGYTMEAGKVYTDFYPEEE